MQLGASRGGTGHFAEARALPFGPQQYAMSMGTLHLGEVFHRKGINCPNWGTLPPCMTRCRGEKVFPRARYVHFLGGLGCAFHGPKDAADTRMTSFQLQRCISPTNHLVNSFVWLPELGKPLGMAALVKTVLQVVGSAAVCSKKTHCLDA